MTDFRNIRIENNIKGGRHGPFKAWECDETEENVGQNDFICKFEAGNYLIITGLLCSLRDSYLKPSAITV
jgi:hypothetical protein